MASQYPRNTVTKKGLALIAESVATKKQLIFTRVVVGDGDVPQNKNISDMTDLVSERIELPVTSGENEGNGQFKISATLSNTSLNVGFFPREVGLYAKVDQGTEVLYSYTNGGNNVGYIPDKTTPIEAETYNIRTVIGNATDITVVLKDGTYCTILDLNAHNNSTDAHSNIFITADKDAAAADNSEKGATTSWVKNALAKFTNFTSSQISDFKSKVIEIMKEKAIEVLQITYKLESNGFIKFGLFGGFTIQWGVIEKYDELLQGGADFKSDQQSKLFPVAFVTKALALVVSDAGYYKNNTLYTGSTDVTGNVRGRIIDNSSFKVGLDYNVVGSHVVDIQWLAIGF